MYTTKGMVYFYLIELSESESFDNKHLFTTDSIADALYLSRSSASQYLNTLFRDGYIIKVQGRPILFYYVDHLINIDFSINNYFYGFDHFFTYIEESLKIEWTP